MDQEESLKAKCKQHGVNYIEPQLNENEEDKDIRWNSLRNQILATTRRNRRSKETAEEGNERRMRRRDYDRKQRLNETAEERDERLMQRRDYEREQRLNETAEEGDERRKQRRESDQRRKLERSDTIQLKLKKQRKSSSKVDDSGCQSNELNHVPNVSAHVVDCETVIKNGIKIATRTKRLEGDHQATVCVICDRFVIGVEKVCMISKDIILQNKSRISVQAFEAHFGMILNPIVVEQYQVDDIDLHGILLSPRAFNDDNGYECCESCRDAMRPSKQENAGTHPPKHAIANGFVIGHIPQILWIDGEDEPRRSGLTDESFNDAMRVALSLQRPYGFIFAFTGGAQQSIMGQYSFFETNQELMGSTVNRYRQSGANDHILIVLAGRFTPQQKEIARSQVSLDTGLYIDILTWLIKTAKHKGFKDVLPPENCQEPRIIEDTSLTSVDESQDPATENVFQGGAFTFTSSHDPSESAGVFKDSTAFTVAMLNQVSPIALVSGGRYISSGKELRLEDIFPLAFPFGIGGLKMPKDRKRPTSISEIECLKHYLRLSLPSFMRGDMILVISHMFNRLKSYQSGVIKCRSTKIYGKPFGDAISTITEEEIKVAANNLTNKIEDSSVAARFLKESVASCSAVGYTSAAAKANRRIMYAFCDAFGIPGVFFSLSPCDECAFRVRLWANAGSQMKMPSLDSDDAECIADFQIRKKTRLRYPGACAIEYESIVQIVLKILFGWDSSKQHGCEGIFGELIAWCVAHEEQGRKTLHGHYECWVKNLNRLRQMLFDSNGQIREAAREEIIKYTDKIMRSSYGDYDLMVTHTCKKNDIESCQGQGADDDANFTSRTGRVDDLFYDHKAQGHDKSEHLQLIRDARNKNFAKEINGKILHCNSGECEKLFSTSELVDMALSYHMKSCRNDPSTRLPIHKNRMDRATYGYPYDYDLFEDLATEDRNFWLIPEVRSLLLRVRVDQHDHMHRPGCFKKNNECRFKLPDMSCSSTRLDIEEPTSDLSNVTTWFRLNCSDEQMIKSTPYLIQTKRPVGCEYFNTHSIPASAVFGCNTNVQIGGPGHIYYTTLYVSKSTQKDDSDRFIYIGTKVIRRLMRMRTMAMQNAAEVSAPNVDFNTQVQPLTDWTEGLSRMLSGICANLSKEVCSPTLAHLIVSNDGSRFEYSHDTANLLIGQAIDYLDGKDIQCRIRTNISKVLKKKILWPDSAVDDYIHRPDDLEEMCLYEFTSKYEKVCKTWKQIDRGQDDNQCERNTYRFRETHPGYEFAHLKKRQFEVVPIVCLPTGGMYRIQQLQMNDQNPSTKVIDVREAYAKNALVMFHPFRSALDLLDEDSTGQPSCWVKLKREMSDNKLFWKRGIDILHNIDDRETAHRMKHATDPLVRETLYNDSEDDQPRRQDKHENPNAIDFSQFDLDDERDIDQDYHILEGFTKYSKRTHQHLMETEDLTKEKLISARISNHSSLLASDESITSKSQNKETPDNSVPEPHYGHEHPTIIQFLNGALITEGYDAYQQACDQEHLTDMTEPLNHLQSVQGIRHNIPTLKGVAVKLAREERMKLDEKQYAAYEIISCSFLLKIIEEEEYNGSSSFLQRIEPTQKQELISKLKAKGGNVQLVMLLCGFAGAGKSSCVKVAQRFCFEFCQVASIPWTSNTFMFTATTGAAASLFEGRTIHDVAFLCGKDENISDEMRKQWQEVMILIIDEMSFFTRYNVEKLDRRLKQMTGRYDVPYGGISIVWTGDFHQLRPVACQKEGALYEGAKNGLFEGSINVAIFLEESHRFDDDPRFGDLLKRLWKGEMTQEDVDLLHTRVVGKNGVTLPDESSDSDIAYACPINKQRNAISAGIFHRHLQGDSFPTVDGNVLPPEHTIIIEADIQSMNSSDKSGKTRVSPELRERIVSTCGDAHCKIGTSKLVDPCIRTYQGAHAMCIDNSKLKTDKVGSGSQCRMRGIKLKKNSPPLQWKNWDGKKVYTVNARHVDYAEMERFPVSAKVKALEAKIDNMRTTQTFDFSLQSRIEVLELELEALKKAQYFRLKPVKHTATVSVSLDDNVSERILLSGVIINQLPINMNDATTGHKLQGMSKDKLIVVSWTTRMANWIYVVLSRVRTLDGLYLLEELPHDILDKISVPRELQAFEARMKQLEESVLNKRRTNLN